MQPIFQRRNSSGDRSRPVASPALREHMLVFAVLLLVLLAFIAPGVTQPPQYQDFADQRSWAGVPHAMDVLSNLPFLLWGMAGVWALRRAIRRGGLDNSTVALTGLFFAGLVVTAAVSAAYHWQPDTEGLLWDRGGMVLAFAGLLGLAALQGISRRAGLALAAAVLVLGPASLQVWAVTGNLLPWSLLQTGGMGLIVWLAWARPRPGASAVGSGTPTIGWSLVIALYVLAKLLELGDQLVFEWTGQLVSGHSLKHVVASCAAWPLVSALWRGHKIRAESGSPVRAGPAPQALASQQRDKRSQA